MNPAFKSDRPTWAILFETPVYEFLTVAPSSIVFLLVANVRLETILRYSLACWVSILCNAARLAAAPKPPQVPCGCIFGLRLDASPIRAPTSYPIINALKNPSPEISLFLAAANNAGKTCIPGWPFANWCPSSISKTVPAVPNRKLTVSSLTFSASLKILKRFLLFAPSDSASARISGSAIPPIIAPRQSATINFAECKAALEIEISVDFPIKLANLVTVLSISVPYISCLNFSSKQLSLPNLNIIFFTLGKDETILKYKLILKGE